MNSRIFLVEIRRYLCPFCGEWHDFNEYDNLLTFYRFEKSNVLNCSNQEASMRFRCDDDNFIFELYKEDDVKEIKFSTDSFVEEKASPVILARANDNISFGFEFDGTQYELLKKTREELL